MHQQNFLHRDMKPENILLYDDKHPLQVKIADFGLATQFQEGQKFKEKIGSPIYMAPEILRSEAYDMKIDIWGVGVIAHILLCGCPPFDGESEEDVKIAIQKSKPSFGSKRIKKHLSKEAIDFITQCLCKEQIGRPHA